MNIAIVKYNAGNIQSVLYALERLGINATVTGDADALRSADKVIFPGVGEASSAMQSLQENGLDAVIKDLKQPVLGICVGMQLLCNHSEENDTKCLGIVPVGVKRFPATSNQQGEGFLNSTLTKAGEGILKVPQVGWNTIYDLRSPLFSGIPDSSYIYNVHSYYATDSQYTIARCNYGLPYAAAVQKDNFYGVQFHTEKSADTGDRILHNFLSL
ncbi:imidazole glycerol phosphate synthase subunit hisH [Cnuella takakiae]|uniref:Imidazole glycerol phosphate synthase subunit HisH n=1 Tax=Cnuella takakiae TaxID=1302690 RepID=A0A1M4YA40_9BACT|nr:imidazole glycerol phosphate synthase subunit HisH [Cnuella takakiae]OLY93086.1 imidazole glycerol phosphate synthase subunit HisH [Cnuella takakiae]SHF02382.1 imidazole glycerol phosphate synthase subunit hisH [Cnuella takakiae]